MSRAAVPAAARAAALAFAASLAIAAAPPARGAESSPEGTQDLIDALGRELSRTRRELQALDGQRADALCETCVGTPSERARLERCRRSYQRLLAGDVIDARIVFGHIDVGKASWDRAIAAAVIEHLTTACPPGYHACGFTRDDDDDEILRKKILGPDGREKEVVLRVATSTDAGDQKARSARAETLFAEGLEGSDLLYYIGHFRDGGGPDFRPPIRRKNGAVDYARYRRERPGLKLLAKGLASGPGPKLLGLFACRTAGPFLELEKVSRGEGGRGLILSDGLVPIDYSAFTMVESLNAVLGQYCDPEFREAIEPQGALGGESRRFRILDFP